MKTKTYDLVKDILVNHPNCRNSDKSLLWVFWTRCGLTEGGVIKYSDFMRATSSESVTRARRKVQEHFPELGSNKAVQREKDKKEDQKGTFVYREMTFRREI